MTTLTTSLPHRLPLPLLISVVLHGSVIGALLYASFHQVVEMPEATQPVSVSLVAPEVQPEPARAQPQVAPQPEPEPEHAATPEPPKAEPVPIPQPVHEPKPRPKPRPVKKEVVKPREEVKPHKAQPTAPPEEHPFQQVKPATAPKRVQSQSTALSDGPHLVSQSKPAYPARAFALRIEGRVRVQFDVDSAGQVENIRILSAQPRNMFEREVRQAMRKWRYEANKPGKDQTASIVFKMNGGSALE